jgi:hypothetical protein
VGQIRDLTASLLVPWRLSAQAIETLLVPMAWIISPLLIVHAYQAWQRDELAIASLPWPVRYALGGAIAYLVLIFGNFEGAEFIYFQF